MTRAFSPNLGCIVALLVAMAGSAWSDEAQTARAAASPAPSTVVADSASGPVSAPLPSAPAPSRPQIGTPAPWAPADSVQAPGAKARPAPAPKPSDAPPAANARTGLRATVAGWVGRPAYERSPRPWNRQKSGRVAMLASFAVPGLGQLYNEREFWAAVAAGVEFYFIGNIVVEQRQANLYRDLMHQDPNDTDSRVLYELHRDNRIQNTWLLGLTMLISGLQSYVDAHLFDFDRSPPPRLQLTLQNGPGAALRLRF